MKVLIKQDTIIWINGKPYEFKKGIQEVDDDDIAIILIESKNAEKQEETDAKKAKKPEA